MRPARGRMARQETRNTHVGERWVMPIQRLTGTKTRKARRTVLPVIMAMGASLGRGARERGRARPRRSLDGLGDREAAGTGAEQRERAVARGLEGHLLVRGDRIGGGRLQLERV